MEMYKKFQHIHFVGIGGIGMSGIAEVMINLGYRVSGSDLKRTAIIDRLERLGCRIFVGHKMENIEGCDLVVRSSAVRENNPEIIAARKKGIPVIPRAEMLAELMRLKYGIAVAGAHGKTTTTSMIATILAHGGIDPTVVIGGRLNSLGTNAKLGQGEFLVAEADESDGSFLKLSPTIAVVTNIDREHLDHYGDIEKIKDTFLQFINKVPFYGISILCLDDPNIPDLIPRIEKRYLTYGLSPSSDIQGTELRFQGSTSSFNVIARGLELGSITMNVPGDYNVSNALAAIGVALELDIPFNAIREALESFSGVERRFQIKGEIKDIMIVDDYGHHPREIAVTLKAAKEGWDKRILCVFQPHRYSRTKLLFHEFLTAFYQADVLVITDIYPAGEDEIPGVSAFELSEGIRQRGHKDCQYIAEKEKIPEYLIERLRPGDMVITLGAGDVWKVGDALIERLGSA
jgi:UDP-N-acetylmuramate--alanine ligase